MRTLKLVIPASIAALGLLISTSSVYGRPEYAKKEKKSCTFCHTKVSSEKTEMEKNLNTTGTCYKENEHSLAKCEPTKK
jgi:hypothetical protein